jgi:hypothetical protein
MSHLVGLDRDEVSEEHVASTFKVEKPIARNNVISK